LRGQKNAHVNAPLNGATTLSSMGSLAFLLLGLALMVESHYSECCGAPFKLLKDL